MDHLYRLTLAVVLLLCAWAMPALGQDYSYCNSNINGQLCPDQGTAAGAAHAQAEAERQGAIQQCTQAGHPNCAANYFLQGPTTTTELPYPYHDRGKVEYVVCQGAGCSSSVNTVYRLFPKANGCAARNATLGDAERVYSGTPPTCVGGCEMTHGATISITVGGSGSGVITTTENTQYTGNLCSLAPGETEPPTPGEDTPDTEEACKPLGDGQTACVKPNGTYCASASTGATFCWGPTQTGEQAQEDKLQRRTPGETRPTDQPATPPPPPATQWSPNSSHSSNSPTHGSYTVTNYSTTGGDTGHNTGGDGDGDDDEGEDGTVSGGGQCPHDGGQLPTCTGDISAVQCAQLVQTYLTRCAVEKVQKGAVSGGIACSTVEPLVCTNLSPYDCWIAAQKKKDTCALQEIADAIGEGEEGGDGEEIDVADAWVDGEGGNGTGEGGEFEADTAGWLSSRSCPTIPPVQVFGKTLHFDITEFCWFLQIGAGLVLMFASIACARILGEAI